MKEKFTNNHRNTKNHKRIVMNNYVPTNWTT